MYETYREPGMEESGGRALEQGTVALEWTASVRSLTRPETTRKRLGVVGALVSDLTVEPLGTARGVSKTPCRMWEEFGGAGRNAAIAMRNYGGTPEVDLLVGRDFGSESRERLLDELPQARLTNAFQATRRSVHLVGGVSYTSRPPMEMRSLPDHLRQTISSQDATIIAPASAADQAFICAALEAAKFAVLQLSTDQMNHAASFRELVGLAAVTVMNHEEARRLTDESEPMRAIMKLCELGCRGAVVTDPRGVWARIEGQWAHAPAVTVPVKKTVGAGDCFTAVWVLARASGWEIKPALALGQAAAARHIADMPGLGSLERLAAWAADQPRTSLVRPTAFRPAASAATVGAAGAAATALSLLAAFS